MYLQVNAKKGFFVPPPKLLGDDHEILADVSLPKSTKKILKQHIWSVNYGPTKSKTAQIARF